MRNLKICAKCVNSTVQDLKSLVRYTNGYIACPSSIIEKYKKKIELKTKIKNYINNRYKDDPNLPFIIVSLRIPYGYSIYKDLPIFCPFKKGHGVNNK